MSVINAKTLHLNKILELRAAAKVLHRGGVIAYPTESCFGLGCDPKNPSAVRRLLAIKRRSYRKGLILIAENLQQACQYGQINDLPMKDEVERSWPGPNTWLLPPSSQVSRLVRGQHEKVAIRVTAHAISAVLCKVFGGAIVSTSANFQGQEALKSHHAVQRQFGEKLDWIVAENIGEDDRPSIIRDGVSGKILRK